MVLSDDLYTDVFVFGDVYLVSVVEESFFILILSEL
jgi:hypothetical protein